MRVLVADDEPGLIRVLTRCLTNWGYEPVVARDGLEAWQVLSDEDPPRVVILDWDMPGLSGVKVCRMLRESERGQDPYVLLLTARQGQTDLVEALEAGADDFISKPFELRELQLRIAKGVSTRERRNTDRSPPLSHQSLGSLPAGFTLGGKFRLEKKIAEGGMASVWQAIHLSLGINVAVKFMKPEFTKNADYTSFEREARAAAQLRSANTVRVYDHGLTKDGTPYLVMEFLVGDALWDRVQEEGPLSPEATILMVQQVAAALDEAHARGIIHRDVKPENIVLSEDPAGGPFQAKLVDFGLAHAYRTETTGVAVAGTPMYMTPEHLCGEVPPSPALDIWGLAVTAYMAMTGVRAYSGTSITDIVKAVCAPPPVPSSLQATIPPAVDAWFARACASEPKDRFPTAIALASAFADAWRGDSMTPSPERGVKSTGTMAPTEPDSSRPGPASARAAVADKRTVRTTRLHR